MSLVEYRRKRRFDQTNEPEPGKALPQGQRAIFVVQLHHASRRHYDFRLQIGDALKSWAVPKGPSYDPKVKRMAVEVEDHPVDYASFEGEIPKGQYGGGHVAQFDHGVWATQGDPEAQLAKGHLRFELFGTKLKGGWHLVRSGKPARQPQWLLFKDDDAYASDLEADDLLADVSAAPTADIRRAGGGKADKKKLKALPAKRARRKNWAKKALALPKAKEAAPPSGPFEPQLAKLGEAPPQGDQWVHEIKWDGYRILATVADGAVRLAVESFSVTSNNVTYAVFGKPAGLFGNDQGYWDFFAERNAPGRLPVGGRRGHERQGFHPRFHRIHSAGTRAARA
mgnify:CR=1 FL=1